MSKPIPPLDLMFLLTETADSPKHVSALMTFEPPASGARTRVAELVRACRAAKPVAPFTYVPEFPLTGVPRWKAAAAVDLVRHVHHLALPAGAGDDAALVELVQRLNETVMDRSRPGFEMFFIEGLADGGFAVFVRLHHAIVDGASAMALLLGSMNDSAATKRIQPFFAVELSAPRPRPPKSLLDRVTALQKSARSQTTAVASLTVGLVKKSLGRLFGGASGSEPFSAPRTPLNETLRTPRSIATLSLPLAEMKAAGKAFGGTLNDVAVTVVDAGAQRYLAGIGKASARPLVVMCPISLRDPGDKEATTKVTAMFVPLGAASLPVAERMRATIANSAAAKAELRKMSKDTAMLYAIAAFGLAEAEAELSHRAPTPTPTKPLASFVLSNVPGSATPLYLNGARMSGMYPISSIAAGMGLNATLASYAGSMDFGFVGNGVALPRLGELARHTREAFDELKAAAAALAPPEAAAADKPAKAAKAAKAAPKARKAPTRAARR